MQVEIQVRLESKNKCKRPFQQDQIEMVKFIQYNNTFQFVKEQQKNNHLFLV